MIRPTFAPDGSSEMSPARLVRYRDCDSPRIGWQFAAGLTTIVRWDGGETICCTADERRIKGRAHRTVCRGSQALPRAERRGRRLGDGLEAWPVPGTRPR